MARLSVLHAAGTAPEHGPVAASSLDGHRAAFFLPLLAPCRPSRAADRASL